MGRGVSVRPLDDLTCGACVYVHFAQHSSQGLRHTASSLGTPELPEGACAGRARGLPLGQTEVRGDSVLMWEQPLGTPELPGGADSQ